MGNNGFKKEELLAYWHDTHACAVCGGNESEDSIIFHHILGRGGASEKWYASIYNAVPIHNNKCHLDMHSELMKREFQERLFIYVFNHLVSKEYKPSNNDLDFIINNRLENLLD